MTTWIVGDVHGCAAELRDLVDRLDLGPDDRLLSCGDLFHRGPDPAGVVDVLDEVGAGFVLGNHERTVLARLGLDPTGPPGALPRGGVVAADLRGDGGLPMDVSDADAPRIVAFLQRSSGYLLTNRTVPGAGPTPDGRDWWLVHAGVEPGLPAAEQSPRALTGIRRLAGRGRPFWYEAWRGPQLVLFGHTAGPVPRAQRVHGRLVALGLDTGCVYGGSLTAYSPERDELRSVPARARYASSSR